MLGNNSFVALLSVCCVSQPLRNITLGIALLDGLALVVALFPCRDRQLDFREGTLEIDRKRDEGQSLILDLCQQPANLALAQEEFARPSRFMVQIASMLVRADVHPQEPDFSVLYHGMAVLQICVAASKGLHLRPFEHQACFDCVEDEIVVSCFAIRNGDSLFFLSHPAPDFELWYGKSERESIAFSVIERVDVWSRDRLAWTACGTLNARAVVCTATRGVVAFFFTNGYIDCAQCEFAADDYS